MSASSSAVQISLQVREPCISPENDSISLSDQQWLIFRCRILKTVTPKSSVQRLTQSQSETQEKELNTQESALAVIDEGMQQFKQIYDDTVKRALEKVDAMYDEFHSNAKERLANETKAYQPEKGFEPKESDQYCAKLQDHLQQKLKEDKAHLKDHWATHAAVTVKFLSDTLQRVEEDIKIRISEAENASPQCGSQDSDSMQNVEKRVPSVKKRVIRFVVGAGLGSAAMASAATIGLTAPIAAATIFSIAVGGFLAVVAKPDSMTEEQARQEVCKRIMTSLDNQKGEEQKTYRDGFEKFVKSSTDTACRHVEEEKQKVSKAVVKLKRKIRVLKVCLSAALPLDKKLEEMELQLKQFREELLEM